MKTNTLLIILLMTAEIILQNGNIYSDEVTQEWVKTYVRTPGTPDLYAPFMALDKFGNSYVAGTNRLNDTNYIAVIKYSTAGVQQWLNLYKYPGEAYYEPMGIAVDSLGNAYVITNYGQGVFNYLNTLTIKFNSNNGTVVWAKKYIGQYGASCPNEIKIDKHNNVYVTGWSDSSLICIKYNSITGDTILVKKYQPAGTITSGNSCTIDDSLNIIITGYKAYCIPYPPPGGCFDTLLTIKYNKEGVLKWAKTYFSPTDNLISIGLKVVNDQYGSVYIMGRTRNNTGDDIFLTLKYNRDGILQWVSTYDGPGQDDDFIKNISIDKIHNAVFITGSVYFNNHREATLIKYNSNSGDSIWLRRNIGLYTNSAYNDVKIDSTGNTYLTGVTFNLTGSGYGVMTTKYTMHGEIAWQIFYNGFGTGLELAIDKYKNIYVCGTTGYDYMVIKYSQIIGVKPLSNKIPSKYELNQNYPNPFNPTTKIKLSIPKKSYIHLKIYDVLGRIKEALIDKELTASEYEVTFNAENYSSGIYFYQMIADGKIIDTKKLTVIK